MTAREIRDAFNELKPERLDATVSVECEDAGDGMFSHAIMLDNESWLAWELEDE